MQNSVIIVEQNYNKCICYKVYHITMGKRIKKRIKYNRFREKVNFKRVNVENRRLEQFEKANRRKKLKAGIRLRLKKLTRVINLNHQYLSE